MKLKIKELAQDADLRFTIMYPNIPIVDGTEAALETFVKLIALECIAGFNERIKTRYEGSTKDSDVGYGMEIVVESIKAKFNL
jgi:hypothetical protein